MTTPLSRRSLRAQEATCQGESQDRYRAAAERGTTMGFINKSRQANATEDAERAWELGNTVFVMATATASQLASGKSLSGVSEQIMSAESVGWRLERSDYVFDTAGIGNTIRGVHTFRRRA